jgi:hydroxymethylglutaryl-CoA lyase
MGLANVYAAVQAGVTHFETAFAGLGGCPFISDAAGNIATEDTAYMLHAMGFETGIDLWKLSAISRRYESLLGRRLPGKLYPLLTAPIGNATESQTRY